MDYTPEVLRNKGVAIVLANIRRGENDWAPVYDANGDLETSEIFVKFTHNIIADIEEAFDGLENWQEAMQTKPVSTLRRTLALALMEPTDQVGMKMIEGRLPEYSNSIGIAWALANGVDPEMASRLLESATVQVDSQIKLLNEEIGNTLTEVEEEVAKVTRGKTQSQPGAKQTKGTKTSGKQAQPKS
tara:strand:- start:125 stop:685 length:561 start_codon:yes stop_codon:yes gene_type:complete